jgi:hypothetical protein
MEIKEKMTKDEKNEIKYRMKRLARKFCRRNNVYEEFDSSVGRLIEKAYSSAYLLCLHENKTKINCTNCSAFGKHCPHKVNGDPYHYDCAMTVEELEKACEETQELLDKQIEATLKLDKENEELTRINDNLEKDRLAHIELEDKLKKENAELKDYRLTTVAKQQTEMSKYALKLEHNLSWYDDQLTKAKELLEKWYKQHSDKGYTETFYQNLLRETENLLWSEVEK